MLQNIRERLRGWVAFAVLAVIGVPLVLTFVSSDFGLTGGQFAARVNGEEISQLEFQRLYQNQLIALQEAQAGEVSPQVEAQLKRDVLNGLVLNRAVTQYVEDAGFRVSDEQVAEAIRGLEPFQVGGQFSKPAYDAILAGQGLSPAGFENEQRALLAVRQLQEGIVESAFFTPAEFRRLIELDQERRDVAYILLDQAALGAAATVTDDEIQAYYATNAPQFQTPESADIEYVEIRLADMARDYAPDEAALRAAYEADPTRFRTAEQRRASHILIAVDGERDDAAALALAKELAAKIADGADFASLARENSSDPGSAAKGGDLGFASQGQFVEPFEKALFALEQGQVSEPVKTQFGYHLIRLAEVRAGAEQPFEAVRNELEDELRRHKAQDEYYALAERLDDLALENPQSLEPIAAETGLPVQKFAGFTRTGGGPFGPAPSLVTAVFAAPVLEEGENTPLIELEEGRAVVARVARHNPPEARPLAEVRNDIAARLRSIKGAAEAQKRGEAILARLQAGEDLSAVAQSTGTKPVQTGPVTRRSPVLPPELLTAVFRAPKPAGDNAVVKGVPLANGSYAVFQLNAVLPGDPDSIPREQLDERKKVLAQRAAVGETEALAIDLRNSAKVVVAPGLFDAEAEEL